MTDTPRVALFADTFHEINGAANVLRHLVNFAREKNYPFLCVRSGRETKFEQNGSVEVLELKRGRLSLPVDADLRYDPFLWRYKNLIGEKLLEFKPDVLHLTGLNDISQIGFYLAHFRKIPAVASWHTNTHEYAARRLVNLIGWLPARMQRKFNRQIENAALYGLMKLYFLAQVQLAPNEELVAQIEKMTRRPTFLMSRGVDTKLFAPEKRRRADGTFNLGFVGRLRTEKNVRFLVEVEKSLQNAGVTDYKFTIVGEGDEGEWLQKNMRQAVLTGVRRGEELAQAYADMDLFVFPSKTDAFGNVVLEAMAAGVPGVVMAEGGPKFLIRHEQSGFIAADDEDFCRLVVRGFKERRQIRGMKCAARAEAVNRSWTKVFEDVFDKYRYAATVAKNVRA